MDPLLNLNALNPARVARDGVQSDAPVTAGSEGNFSDLLKQALDEVNESQATAEQEARNLMTGDSTDMHTAILAVQKADVSFQMMMAVRSKLIEAYREVMRMQI